MTAYFSDHHQGVNVATFAYLRVSTRDQDVGNQTLGRPSKTTARDRAKIAELHAAGLSLSQLAAQFGIGKATVHSIIKGGRTAAQTPAPGS